MSNGTKFPQVFNRLCHMAALSREGKTRAAVDNLVLTVMAIDKQQALTTAAEIVRTIDSNFGLTFNEASVQTSVDRHLAAGKLLRDRTTKVLTLAPKVKADVETQINEANALEDTVRDEWFAALDGKHELTPSMKQQLWGCLRTYMAKAFQRHGAETIMLLAPSQPEANETRDNLVTYLEESINSNCSEVPVEIATTAIPEFFVNSPAQRTRYIAQLLDGTFTYFALTVDEATSAYLKEGISTLSLFLDTNFIFGVLGLHASPLNDVSLELVDTIKTNRLPFKLYYHEETLLELRRTIGPIADRLKARRFNQAASRAAIQSGLISGIELEYHRRNIEAPIDPEIYFSKYEHIADILDDYGFKIYRTASSKALDEERHLLVAEYEHFITAYRPLRPKKYEALNHDMAVWQTVKGLRKAGAIAFDAGAFFLTNDYYLYKFDWQRLRDRNSLGLIVLSNQFLQLLRPFVGTSGQSDQRFIEIFAIPEFRTAVSDYAKTSSKVLSYLSTYAGLSEQTALRVLTNEVLLQQLRDVDEESKEFQELVDNAIAADNKRLLEKASELEAAEKAASERAAQNEALAKQKEEEVRLAQQRLAAAENVAQESQRTTALAYREADEARQLAENIKTGATAKEQTQEQSIADLKQRLDSYAIKFRWFIGALIAVVGISLILLVPKYINWPWLDAHPNRLGLYGCAIAIVCALSWAVADSKRRNLALITMAVPAILVLLQIVGK
jgi:hypothetical protein